jgi:chitin disaccharide deacetylase
LATESLNDLAWTDTLMAQPGPELDTLPAHGDSRSAWSETLPGANKGRGLCVAADDVGLHPGVNGAAIDGVLSGRLQALACRVGAPHFPEVVEHLHRLRGLAVDIGLQLDLCQFSLNAQVRRPLKNWLTGLGLPASQQLREEVSLQFDTFEAALGHAPQFVAGFRHVQQLSPVRELVMAEIERRYAPGHRPWVRTGRRGGQDRLPQALRAWAVERGGAHETAAAARAIGSAHNRGLLGVYDFEGGLPRFRQLLERWLQTAREGELLVCHPSVPTVVRDPLLAARLAEHRLLASAEWPALVERMGLDLQPMSRLLARRSRW